MNCSSGTKARARIPAQPATAQAGPLPSPTSIYYSTGLILDSSGFPSMLTPPTPRSSWFVNQSPNRHRNANFSAGSSKSPTNGWQTRSEKFPSAKAMIPPTTRWSPSAAPEANTPAPSPKNLVSLLSSAQPMPACSAHVACAKPSWSASLSGRFSNHSNRLARHLAVRLRS